VLVRYAGLFTDVSRGFRDASQSLDHDVSFDVVKLEDHLEIWRALAHRRRPFSNSGFSRSPAVLDWRVGIVSYSVNRSVREIGIRVALGANGADLLRLVLWQALRPVLIGGFVGVLGCAAVSPVLSSMLFGVNAHDPIAFVCVPVFLLAVALFASYIPARCALHVDPMIALRCE
jgi:hypothetical protein